MVQKEMNESKSSEGMYSHCLFSVLVNYTKAEKGHDGYQVYQSKPKDK